MAMDGDFSDKDEPAGPEREPAQDVDPLGEQPPRRPKVLPSRGSCRIR
jgi:hypothetical protein